MVLVAQGLPQKAMQENMKIKRKNLEYHLKKLETAGLIRKVPGTKPLFFELTEAGKQHIANKGQNLSVGIRTPLIKIHNFSVEMPLVRDVSQGFWEKSWELNNWIKSFKDLQGLGVSVERTPKTVTINFRPQEVREENITPLIFNGVFSIVGHLAKNGVEVNPWGMKISRQEYASDQPLVKPLTDRGVTYRQSLGRPVQKIFTTDPEREAAAWLDHSQGRPEVDTNDLAYAKDVIRMPAAITEIRELTTMSFEFQKVYTENLKLHMGVMNKILKVTAKLDRQLSQRSIREFLRR